MTGRRTLIVVIALAMLCIIGLVGMLLVDGVGDVLFFLLAISPLLAGAWQMWRRRLRR